jgi:hypothetical protein
VVGDGFELPRLGALHGLQRRAQLRHPRTLGGELRLGRHGGGEQAVDQRAVQIAAQALQQFAGEFAVLVDRQPEAHAELGVVLEERIRPGRAAAVRRSFVQGVVGRLPP